MKVNSWTQLHIFDSLLCLFIFFPLTVLYWRGMWDLWGVYIDPKHSFPAPQWILLCISLFAYGCYYIGPLLESHLNKARQGLYFLITRLYLWIHAALYVCYWRAVWETVDYYLPSGLLACVIQFAITYGILLLLQSSRTCVFPPFYVSLDTRDEVLLRVTRFNTRPLSLIYIVDSLFTHFIIVALAICTWRAMWNILAHLIFPRDPVLSDLVCLGVGMLLGLIIFLIEELLAVVVLGIEKEGNIYKLLFEDLCYLVIYVVSMVMWRGAWRCTVRYIISDPELGGWVCFLVGSVGLTMLQLHSYIGSRGCVLDGFDMGRDAFFPTYYLRHYLYNDYYDSSYSKSGSTTPPFPLSTSTLSFHKGSTLSMYDNLTVSERLLFKMNQSTPSPVTV